MSYVYVYSSSPRPIASTQCRPIATGIPVLRKPAATTLDLLIYVAGDVCLGLGLLFALIASYSALIDVHVVVPVHVVTATVQLQPAPWWRNGVVFSIDVSRSQIYIYHPQAIHNQRPIL